ncbi:MAG: pectate lyase [Verrucomicrobiota bacterium]
MNFEQGMLSLEVCLRELFVIRESSFKIGYSTGLGHPLNPVRWILLVILCLGSTALKAGDFPDEAEIIAVVAKAATYHGEQLSVSGGYASSWDEETGVGYSEHREGVSLISIQPHGTTTIGLRMLRAYEATGEPLFLKAAKGAAFALAASQLSSGGWEADYDFDPEFVAKRHWRVNLEDGDTDPGERKTVSTLDDHKTTSALQFLLEFVHAAGIDPPEEVARSLEFGMDGLLAAQFPNGGWPQRFTGPADSSQPAFKARVPDDWPREWPREDYGSFATLNDGNLNHVMSFLLRAQELTGETRFRDAAIRLGDFFLLAQLPEPQSAWAQQYDEQMHPVWARKFEPPAVSSVESYSAAETLLQIWQATGDEKYRGAALAGLEWIRKSQLPGGQWARFYELETNRPLYCEADTYTLSYEDDNLPTHYGFKVDEGLGRKVERLVERFQLTPEESRQKEAPPQWSSTWEKRAKGLRGKVRQAIESMEDEGYWLEDGKIDAGLFVKHVGVMTDYLDAMDQSRKTD